MTPARWRRRQRSPPRSTSRCSTRDCRHSVSRVHQPPGRTAMARAGKPPPWRRWRQPERLPAISPGQATPGRAGKFETATCAARTSGQGICANCATKSFGKVIRPTLAESVRGRGHALARPPRDASTSVDEQPRTALQRGGAGVAGGRLGVTAVGDDLWTMLVAIEITAAMSESWVGTTKVVLSLAILPN